MEDQGDRGNHPPPRTSEVPYHDLWTKPFRENTDPSFLWLGPQYRDAFAALRAAVLQNAGLLLLSGEVGTGKTMLANALADGLGAEGVRVAKLAYAGLHLDEFRHGIAQALELPVGPDTRESLPAQLAQFLREAYSRREKVLLVLDEAQDLDATFLDEIDGLARAGREAGRGKVNVLNILLVGQTDLGAILGRRDSIAREDHMAVRFHLGPLAPDQVAHYIAFRLGVAGADRQLFSGDAIREISAASGGVPRLINRICDGALLVASQRNERVVSAEVVRSSVDDLGLAVTGGHTAGADRRPARGGLRRIASTAAIALAIVLGITFYHGGRAPDGRQDRPSESLTPLADAQPAVKSIRPAMVEHPAAVERAAPTWSRVETDGGMAAIAPKTEVALPVVQRAVGTRSVSRDIGELQRTLASRPRVEPVPARITETPALPARTWSSPAVADRSPGEPRVPSTAATPSPRPIKGGSEESDDPAAIINWLLEGNRSGSFSSR